MQMIRTEISNDADGADDADGESQATGRKPLSFIVIFLS